MLIPVQLVNNTTGARFLKVEIEVDNDSPSSLLDWKNRIVEAFNRAMPSFPIRASDLGTMKVRPKEDLELAGETFADPASIIPPQKPTAFITIRLSPEKSQQLTEQEERALEAKKRAEETKRAANRPALIRAIEEDAPLAIRMIDNDEAAVNGDVNKVYGRLEYTGPIPLLHALATGFFPKNPKTSDKERAEITQKLIERGADLRIASYNTGSTWTPYSQYDLNPLTEPRQVLLSEVYLQTATPAELKQHHDVELKLRSDALMNTYHAIPRVIGDLMASYTIPLRVQNPELVNFLSTVGSSMGRSLPDPYIRQLKEIGRACTERFQGKPDHEIKLSDETRRMFPLPKSEASAVVALSTPGAAAAAGANAAVQAAIVNESEFEDLSGPKAPGGPSAAADKKAVADKAASKDAVANGSADAKMAADKSMVLYRPSVSNHHSAALGFSPVAASALKPAHFSADAKNDSEQAALINAGLFLDPYEFQRVKSLLALPVNEVVKMFNGKDLHKNEARIILAALVLKSSSPAPSSNQDLSSDMGTLDLQIWAAVRARGTLRASAAPSYTPLAQGAGAAARSPGVPATSAYTQLLSYPRTQNKP